MNLAEFLARRAAQPQPKYRELCPRCWKTPSTCYCAQLRPFLAPVPFVILQHSEEAKNPIATARMAHLSIRNSALIIGREFAANQQVEALLAAPNKQNVLLYPGREAAPIEQVLAEEHPETPLVFWVIDARWSQVAKMLRLSPNVQTLPMVRFTPSQASQFQLRRQPKPHCVSTIEAMFQVIDRMLQLRQDPGREHQALLDVFQYFVRQQLDFVDVERDTRHKIAKALRIARRQLRAAAGNSEQVGV